MKQSSEFFGGALRPLRHSNIDVLYVPIDVKETRIRMLKRLQSILEKIYFDDINVFAFNIIDKYEK